MPFQKYCGADAAVGGGMWRYRHCTTSHNIQHSEVKLFVCCWSQSGTAAQAIGPCDY